MTPLCKVEVTLPPVLGSREMRHTVVSMSEQEFSRLEVLLRVQSGRLRVSDAWALIGLRRRQVFATSLLSKHRGKASNHRLPAAVRALALSLGA
jgi:hypothetical protein